jgi:hypothetical protein|tara:strand:+ start:348 stop:536 length:189 start_codon:yes stop_codon:yes gene_type:complete
MSDEKETPKKTSIFKKKSDAGKGDVPRLGISYEEWEQKYEKIFGKKEESVRSYKSDNSGSKS